MNNNYQSPTQKLDKLRIELLSESYKILYRFDNMSPEDALKTFKTGLKPSGYVNFGNDLPRVIKKRLELDLANDPKRKLLEYHWTTDFIEIDGKSVAYFISFTQKSTPGLIIISFPYVKFEAMFPLKAIADRIKDINENTLLVKATKDDGAIYSDSFTEPDSEQEYTFLKPVVQSKFIKGVTLWERRWQFFENPNFNPFENL